MNSGQDKSISICQAYFVFVPLYLNKANYIEKLSRVFSVAAAVHFSAVLKAFVLRNLFKDFRLDITFATCG